jgi:hypothetical protein
LCVFERARRRIGDKEISPLNQIRGGLERVGGPDDTGDQQFEVIVRQGLSGQPNILRENWLGIVGH